MVPEAFANGLKTAGYYAAALVSVEDDGAVTTATEQRASFWARRTRLEDISPTGFSGDGLYGVETLDGPGRFWPKSHQRKAMRVASCWSLCPIWPMQKPIFKFGS